MNIFQNAKMESKIKIITELASDTIFQGPLHLLPLNDIDT